MSPTIQNIITSIEGMCDQLYEAMTDPESNSFDHMKVQVTIVAKPKNSTERVFEHTSEISPARPPVEEGGAGRPPWD